MRACSIPVLFVVSLAGAARAQTPADKPPARPAPLQKMSAEELLRRVDQKSNDFKDATFTFKMRIKEPSGQVREVEFMNIQKGTQKRLVRFLAPGDIKGMGFLVESQDTMYALLPAFGNRVRRLGTHQKNQNFMGSDLAYEDMSAIEFASAYGARFAGEEGGSALLDLSLRPGKQAEFPRLRLWVDPNTHTVSKVEYYDAAGKKLRTQVRADYRVFGTHHTPGRLIFTDHRRGNHETELLLLDVKFDTGLTDDEFTVRALQRN